MIVYLKIYCLNERIVKKVKFEFLAKNFEKHEFYANIFTANISSNQLVRLK